MARKYAKRLPLPLSLDHCVACISIAQKYVEDEPLSRYDLFPRLQLSDRQLAQVEWDVLTQLDFKLRL